MMLLIIIYNMYYNEFCLLVIVDGGSGQHVSPWSDTSRWPAVALGKERVGENIVSYDQNEELVPSKEMFRRQESDFSAASLQRQHQQGNSFTGQQLTEQ
jgi:hypothetical protein